jgi:hypothetical protein
MHLMASHANGVGQGRVRVGKDIYDLNNIHAGWLWSIPFVPPSMHWCR